MTFSWPGYCLTNEMNLGQAEKEEYLKTGILKIWDDRFKKITRDILPELEDGGNLARISWFEVGSLGRRFGELRGPNDGELNLFRGD